MVVGCWKATEGSRFDRIFLKVDVCGSFRAISYLRFFTGLSFLLVFLRCGAPSVLSWQVAHDEDEEDDTGWPFSRWRTRVKPG